MARSPICTSLRDPGGISAALATTWRGIGVIPGLVPGIQLSVEFGACGTMDPGDKHRDDNLASA